MQSDEIVWHIINHQFCAFKAQLPGVTRRAKSTKTSGNAGNANSKLRTFCRHEDNVNGLCSRVTCPLANSRYATVRENNAGVIMLRIKEIERSHLPSQMWREVKLSASLTASMQQISEELAFWPRASVNRVKQRLVRLRQVQLRTRKMILKRERQGGQTLVTDPKKTVRRERKHEAMAERAAEVDLAVKSELLQRLRSGTYGTVYNLDAAFDKVVDQAQDEQYAVSEEEEEEQEQEQEEHESVSGEYEEEFESDGHDLFVEDFSSDSGDVEDLWEDLGPIDGNAVATSMKEPNATSTADSPRKRANASASSSVVRSSKRRRHVELELETEDAATDQGRLQKH